MIPLLHVLFKFLQAQAGDLVFIHVFGVSQVW